MNLLHLPVEIFAEIIHAHLQRSGWAAAVRARYVCKTFAAAIQNDIFGRYSSTYYWHTRPNWKERLLGPNMHTLLFKMGPTRCNSMYVLNHMEATVDFLMDFSYYKMQSQRERYRLALCNAMSAALSVNDILAYLRDGPYDDSISVRKNMGRADTIGMLAAAAAVNSEPALRFLVGKYFLETDATLGDATYTYEAGRIGAQGLSQGLVLAVQNGWLGAARLLIESGAQIKKSEYDDTVCAPALWHAVKRGHVDMVMLLLAYGVVKPAKNSKKHAGFWTLTMKRGTKMASLMEEAWMIRTRKAPVSKLNGIV
ncbi:hypothetical protein IG631_19519 [Alternaria alternata]|nr:hypothetical protein IG631_19519 [Alternaria alternata]